MLLNRRWVGWADPATLRSHTKVHQYAEMAATHKGASRTLHSDD